MDINWKRRQMREVNEEGLRENKAGYTTIQSRAGVVFELLEHLGRSSEAKDCKNMEKGKKWTHGTADRLTDQPINQPKNRPTNRPTN